MRSVALSVVMLLSVFFCCSCATYETGEDGNSYKALTARQKERLVIISRGSLTGRLEDGIITRQEYYDAMHNEPMVRIDYRGDRYGTATVTWRTRGRQLEFRYDEDLTAEIIEKCSFAISISPPQERRIQPDKSIRSGR